jgi:hypothetical protein
MGDDSKGLRFDRAPPLVNGRLELFACVLDGLLYFMHEDCEVITRSTNLVDLTVRDIAILCRRSKTRACVLDLEQLHIPDEPYLPGLLIDLLAKCGITAEVVNA